MVHSFKDLGVVISSRRYSEADRILTLFTKGKGKMVVVAKGVRKLTSRKRGSLEVLNEISFSAVSGKGMGIIVEVSLLNDFGKVKKDLKKAAVSYFMMEAVMKLTREDEPHEEVYQIIVSGLKELSKTKNLKSFRDEFSKKILSALGFWDKEKELASPDELMSQVSERDFGSIRVGKKIAQ